MLDKTIRIHAPPERVFEELTRIHRAPRWHPGTLRAVPHQPGQPLTLGGGFHLVEETLGLRLEADARVTALTPQRHFAWRQTHGDYAQHEGAYTLEPEPGDITRVRLRMRLELPHVLPWMIREHEIEHALTRREDDALLNLKDVCERPT